MMTGNLILYSAKICPFSQRVRLALEEAKINYTRIEIDLQNKPEWYASKVNPASKVPAVAYGSLESLPSGQPSPESQKITESLVLLEFVADISGKLLSDDPVQRAKTRFFIDSVSNSVTPLLHRIAVLGEPAENLYRGLDILQSLLPAEGFAMGPEFTIADASVAPFLARLEIALKNDFGAYDEGEGVKVYEVLRTNPKFSRYRKYLADLKARDCFKKTFDENYIEEQCSTAFISLRAQRKASKSQF